MSPRLSNGIPIRIGNRDFLTGSKRYRACLPCSVAGTREVCQDTPLPKPNGWFCPGSHFFLFLFFDHFMHMCIIDLGHLHLTFLSPHTAEPLQFFSSPPPVFMPYCWFVVHWVDCLHEQGWRVFFFFLLESIGNLPVFQQSRKPHPHPPATIRGPYFSFSPGPGALHQEHVFWNSHFNVFS